MSRVAALKTSGLVHPFSLETLAISMQRGGYEGVLRQFDLGFVLLFGSGFWANSQKRGAEAKPGDQR